MTLIESLVKLRDDIKLWVTNNLNNKADKIHSHSIEDVTNLQSTLDSKYVRPEEGISSVDLADKINNSISAADDHIINTDVHITAMERNTWNNTLSSAKTYTDTKINDLIGSAPETLDTLKEIADAISEHQDITNAINEAIGTKANAIDLTNHTNNSNIHITDAERIAWNAKAKQSDLKTHVDDEYVHITSEERMAWNKKSDFSGSYTDLSNRPTIPSKTSQLTNDSNYVTTDNKVKQKAAITTNENYPVLLAASTSINEETDSVNKTSTLKYNPNTQTLVVPNVAGNASSATKAEQDGSGKIITDTYATKESLTNQTTRIDNILSGTLAAGNAKKLGGVASSDFATKEWVDEYFTTGIGPEGLMTKITYDDNGDGIVNQADMAVADGDGNVIKDTYATKEELESIDVSDALEEGLQQVAATYATKTELNATNTNVTNIVNGTTTIAKATSATKATQDGNGKIIADTYLPKTGGTLSGDIIVSQTTANEPMVRVTDGTHTIDLICGSGGVNRGLYDREINNWLCYNGADNKGVFNGNASTATKLATARTISLTGSVTGSGSFDGSGNLSIATSTNHTHSYLPLSGGTVTNTIHSSKTTSTYLAGNQGGAIINSTASAGSYTMLVKQNSTNGYFTLGCYQDKFLLNYTAKSTVDAGTNSPTKTVTLLNESGNAIFPGTVTGAAVYGAVWNDYAEFRSQTEEIKPGYCVASTDNGQVYKTTEKFQACDGIVSDTFGFAIGETDECKTPLAVAGRVLAYCEGDRNTYHSGDTVCAGPDGKVCKMTREEIREWPDRIIGVVSEIPQYETWGTGNVQVDNRIWIKIK